MIMDRMLEGKTVQSLGSKSTPVVYDDFGMLSPTLARFGDANSCRVL